MFVEKSYRRLDVICQVALRVGRLLLLDFDFLRVLCVLRGERVPFDRYEDSDRSFN